MQTLYVTDLVGTLLNSSDQISQFSIETINGLVAKGMQFAYATARSLLSASEVAGLVRKDILRKNPVWLKISRVVFR